MSELTDKVFELLPEHSRNMSFRGFLFHVLYLLSIAATSSSLFSTCFDSVHTYSSRTELPSIGKYFTMKHKTGKYSHCNNIIRKISYRQK